MDVDIDRAALEAVLLLARRETLMDASTRLNERCQFNSPVDTGNLRRSHRINGPDAEAREAEVEAAADYSLYVHEGTRRQRAQPWMTRSVDELAAEEAG